MRTHGQHILGRYVRLVALMLHSIPRVRAPWRVGSQPDEKYYNATWTGLNPYHVKKGLDPLRVRPKRKAQSRVKERAALMREPDPADYAGEGAAEARVWPLTPPVPSVLSLQG